MKENEKDLVKVEEKGLLDEDFRPDLSEAIEDVPADLEPTHHEDDDAEEEEMQEKPDYGEEIKQIIRSNASPKMMKGQLEDYHANDIAEILPDLTMPERVKVYRVLDDVMLSDILEYLDEEDAGKYLVEMDPKRAAAVITEIEPDDAVSILRSIPRDRRVLLIDLLDEKSRNDVRLIASFDEEEIGSRMTTNYIVIRENISVKEAMTELVRQAAENDNISTIFVVDESGEFYGAIDLKELIIARQGQALEDLIVTSFPYVYGHESIDECIEKLKDYSENSIPVLDNTNRLIGVITSTDIIEVVDEEMGEDYAKFAGLTAEEDIEEPLVRSMRKRLPWLITLLILGLGVSAVVGMFEHVVARLTIIMSFQSMILDMSGNSGTQSLAVTIRVLTDENLTARQKIKQFFKELRVGFSNGIVLALISFVLVAFYIFLFKGHNLAFGFMVSGCLAASLMIAMTIASSIGTLIPMFFKKIGVDPAVASGPFITTLNDFIAVVVYYSLCYVFLLNVFHLG